MRSPTGRSSGPMTWARTAEVVESGESSVQTSRSFWVSPGVFDEVQLAALPLVSWRTQSQALEVGHNGGALRVTNPLPGVHLACLAWLVPRGSTQDLLQHPPQSNCGNALVTP